MKIQFTTMILVLFAASAVLLTAADESAEDGKALVTKWQHLALQHDAARGFPDSDLARQINELGRKGWELVTVLNFAEEGTTTRTIYYFKKPL